MHPNYIPRKCFVSRYIQCWKNGIERWWLTIICKPCFRATIVILHVTYVLLISIFVWFISCFPFSQQNLSQVPGAALWFTFTQIPIKNNLEEGIRKKIDISVFSRGHFHDFAAEISPFFTPRTRNFYLTG